MAIKEKEERKKSEQKKERNQNRKEKELLLFSCYVYLLFSWWGRFSRFGTAHSQSTATVNRPQRWVGTFDQMSLLTAPQFNGIEGATPVGLACSMPFIFFFFIIIIIWFEFCFLFFHISLSYFSTPSLMIFFSFIFMIPPSPIFFHRSCYLCSRSVVNVSVIGDEFLCWFSSWFDDHFKWGCVQTGSTRIRND